MRRNEFIQGQFLGVKVRPHATPLLLQETLALNVNATLEDFFLNFRI